MHEQLRLQNLRVYLRHANANVKGKPNANSYIPNKSH